ncbi:MAG: hypothetical protein ACYSWP_12185 [Planctomycetota bacterium]
MRLLKKRSGCRIVAVLSVAILGVFMSDDCFGFPRGKLKAMKMPPWEIVVQTASQEQGIRFPVKVDDVNKPFEMNTELPIIGTPIKIKLERYLPDFKLLMDGVPDANGGIVVQLKAQGQNLNQDIWLSSTDIPRRSITASIGKIAVRYVRDPEVLKTLIKEMLASRSVGILSVMDANGIFLFESIARAGKEISVPKTKYKIEMLDYVQHFTIDMKTKKVSSGSDKPVNPALQVRLSGVGEPQEQWLWSKIKSSPHKGMQEKFRLEFTDFDLGGIEGSYMLAGSSKEDLWALFLKDGKIQAEKVKLGQAYPFLDKSYTFKVNKIFYPSVIKTDWENGADELTNPGIITSITEGDKTERTALEFGKQFNYRSKEHGTIVLLYRRQQQMK